jgi:preprotein translocase subunit SecG
LCASVDRARATFEAGEEIREAALRSSSASDARRAARRTWLLIALFMLVILLLVFVTASGFAHCTGIDHVGVCLDQRIGGRS